MTRNGSSDDRSVVTGEATGGADASLDPEDSFVTAETFGIAQCNDGPAKRLLSEEPLLTSLESLVASKVEYVPYNSLSFVPLCKGDSKPCSISRTVQF